MVMLKMGGGWTDYVMHLIANRHQEILLYSSGSSDSISAICQDSWIKKRAPGKGFLAFFPHP